jgi:hypothetical protein
MIAFWVLAVSSVFAAFAAVVVRLVARGVPAGDVHGGPATSSGPALASAAQAAPGADPPAPEPAAGFALEPELRAALHAAAGQAAPGGPAPSIAVAPGLTLRADRRTLRTALAAVLGQAMAAPACEEVLVTARLHGGRMEIAVLDDGPVADVAGRRAALREAEQAIGLQGGSLEIVACPEEGTTVLLRLPVADPTRARAAKPAPRTAAASVAPLPLGLSAT